MTQDATVRRHGVADKETLISTSGLEFLRAIVRGDLPAPPICQTMNFAAVLVDPGHVVFEGTPDLRHYNPIGSVHGGYAATLLDSCMGCAVHSLLEAGFGYTTMEFKVSLLRPITAQTGTVRAVGTIINRGRRAAYAEGRLVDARDRVLAHATTTCLAFYAFTIVREPSHSHT